MKKSIISLLLIIAFSISITPVFALTNTGGGNYGSSISEYDIISTDYKYTKGTRTWFGVGGTDKHEYLTYYLYSKLRIKTLSLANNKFTKLGYDNRVTASYQEVLSLKKEYQLTTSIGWEVIDNASISLSLTNYQSWEYRYSVGEEITFRIDNPMHQYVGIALVSVEIQIVERNLLKEVYFGGAFGNTEQGSRTYNPTFKTHHFTIDYDVMPVFYNELPQADQNKFEMRNGEYVLKLTQTYNPNFDIQYYESLPSGLRTQYYRS